MLNKISTVDECYKKLVDLYDQSQKNCIPVSTNTNLKNQDNPRWFNKEVKKATSLKYKLYCKLRSSPHNLELKQLYSAA